LIRKEAFYPSPAAERIVTIKPLLLGLLRNGGIYTQEMVVERGMRGIRNVLK
jgi:hypothetical protein